MAAFDFPSSPSVNQTYTANGVTWKWNGTMWMRVSGAGYLEKIEEGNTKVELDDSGSGNIIATVDGTEALRVDSSGRVLLGTTTVGDGSADNLTIADVGHCGMTIRSGTSSVGGIYLGDGTSGSDQYRGYIEYNHSGDFIRFGTAAAEKLRITSAGRMGVGTNDPAALLEVRDSENTTQGNAQIRISKGVGDGAAPTSVSRANSYLHIGGSEYHTSFGRYNIAFGYTNDEVGSGIPAYIGFVETSLSGYTIGDLVFGTRVTTSGTGNPTERLRITSGGSVAIGVNSPSDKLHVGGNNAFIRVDRPNGNPGLALIYNSTNSTRADIDVTTGGDLRFATNSSTERLRVTSGGKIGVNNTSPLSDLQVITAGQTQDGTFRIGGSSASLGLVLDYDQSSATVSRITANPTYTNTSSLLKICVDGDANPNQLVLQGDGKIGINNSSPPVRLAVHESDTDCKLLLSSSWSGSQQIIFGGGASNSDGSGNNTAAKIIVQASAPGGAATGYMSFYTNVGNNIYERLRLTPEGNIWTVNSSIMHGSGDVTNFVTAGRTSNNNISIRAGNPSAGTTPANSNSAIKIYPAGVRSGTIGNLTGGIAWQHLDPDNGTWDSSYGAGAQIWMGAALHDTPGQERDRFNLWMNSGTSGNSQPNQLAIEAYPNGMVRHPKVPAFMVRNSNNSGAFSAGAIATWNVTILNNGSGFANGKFTAPIDGIYHFSCMMLSQSGTRLFHEFRVNGTRVDGTRSEGHAVSGSFQTNTITMTYSLSASDYVEVYVGPEAGYGGTYTNFNGFLVG